MNLIKKSIKGNKVLVNATIDFKGMVKDNEKHGEIAAKIYSLFNKKESIHLIYVKFIGEGGLVDKSKAFKKFDKLKEQNEPKEISEEKKIPNTDIIMSKLTLTASNNPNIFHFSSTYKSNQRFGRSFKKLGIF